MVAFFNTSRILKLRKYAQALGQGASVALLPS